MSKTTTVALLLGCIPLLSACDDGTDPPSDLEFRGGQCATVTVTSTAGTKYKYQGWWPDDGDPWWFESLSKHIEDQTRTMLAGTVEYDESMGKSCHLACEELGLSWEGGGCVIDSAFELGEPELLRKGKGAQFWGVEVLGEAELGCACE